jgi:iron complex transport system ATP-binding protein
VEIVDAYLKLQNGDFSYGERPIFKGLNLEIHKAEVMCILGANGCGKTTLLRCLNGSMRLHKGTVHIDNSDIGDLNVEEIAKKIGFVFQEHTAPFPFSVLEVVRMGRAPHLKIFASPSHKDNEIALEKLELVGMLHLKDKPYTQISGGERQLVLIARTLAQEPQIILMDEPTSHLDYRNQTIILQIINRLAVNGLGVLMTSHLPDHALLYSGRVALMKNGQFISTGKPDEVMTDQSLKEVYDIDIKIIEVTDPYTHEQVKMVLPKRASINSSKTS